MKLPASPPLPPLDHSAAADWFVRLRGDDADPQLRRAFEAWMSADLGHRLAYADVAAAAWAAEQVSGEIALPSDRVPQARRVRWPVARYAIASLLGLALVWLLPTWRGWDDMRADWVTASSEVREIALEDGSRLWLDADSAVSQDFSAEQRRIVLLRGALYVQVKANPARPFVVDAESMTATALGTRYSVSRYGDGSVAVEEGRVAVERGAQRIEIVAGQSVDCDAVTCAQQSGSAEVAVWRNGLLKFESAELSEVVATLRAHMRTRVIVWGDIRTDVKVTALIPSQDAESALRSLCERHGLRLQQWGGWLVVRS